jgi:site-specific DNA-cytosine methylase
MITDVIINHFHFCCGLGGGAAGFNQANPRVGNLRAKFNCLGGIDVDPGAIRNFKRLTGVDGTVMDLFTRDQYTAFWGKEPPSTWTEATPADIRRAARNQHPEIVFISSPCKGASGLLSEALAQTPKYQALNGLTLRCIWLMLEAWKDDPNELIVFENVPRLAKRGRHLLDQIHQLLEQYGYAVAETTHDCGQIGGLAQSRKRFLLVARYRPKVPAFLYEPEKRSLRPVGDVLGQLPLPGDDAAGPMHVLPNLHFKTWLRLALVTAGSDWRSLQNLAVDNGYLRDVVLMPERRADYLGVNAWDAPIGVISGRGTVTTGAFAIADPRLPESNNRQNGFYRVVQWDRPVGTVTGAAHVAGAAMSVADPRLPELDEQCAPVIISLDGTRHRPLTTFELAALQGLFDPGESFSLDGTSHSKQREQIGNAVPRPAACAIAGVMGTTLLLSRSGQIFQIAKTPIWVRPLAIAIAVDTPAFYQ